MASPSKEENLLCLILESSPLKHWHFEDLLRKSEISRGALNKWLKKYVKEKLLYKKKENNKFPYFVVGKDNPVYKVKKKQYMLNKIYNSGLIKDIINNPKIKIAIIFGSTIKGDWYKESDLDLFILGQYNFESVKYEKSLNRDIEIHLFKHKHEIEKVSSGLMKNIINGYLVKGNMLEIAEAIV